MQNAVHASRITFHVSRASRPDTPHSALRTPRFQRAFTMIEIALSLAIIGFALVAIIGVLPLGMNVQKENREETIINQDASVFLNAIRNGARGLDDLTNYVMAITNYGDPLRRQWESAGSTDRLSLVHPRPIPRYRTRLIALHQAAPHRWPVEHPQIHFRCRKRGRRFPQQLCRRLCPLPERSRQREVSPEQRRRAGPRPSAIA